MFVTVGMCEQAVDAYLKLSRVEDAVKCCVDLNQVSERLSSYILSRCILKCCLVLVADTWIVCVSFYSGTWLLNWLKNMT